MMLFIYYIVFVCVDRILIFHVHSVSLEFKRIYIYLRWEHGCEIASHGPLTRYVKLLFAHAPGMPGTFPPTADFEGNR